MSVPSFSLFDCRPLLVVKAIVPENPPYPLPRRLFTIWDRFFVIERLDLHQSLVFGGSVWVGDGNCFFDCGIKVL
jgi:hypothetical protein